jgi:DNA-binding HxlR family transcriptional regulator
MVGKRKYGEGCAVAHALDLVGERWALLVVRELLLGPKRFTDLRSGIAGVSADVLSQRLRELVDAGVIAQVSVPPPTASQTYELTQWGAELRPVIDQLALWGSQSPAFDPLQRTSVDSLVLSMDVLCDPRVAFERSADLIALNIDGQRFVAQAVDGHLDVRRGAATSAAGTLTTSRTSLASMLYGGRTLAEAEAQGEATVTGNSAAVQRFMSSFRSPPTREGND